MIPPVTDHGGDSGTARDIRRSRLSEYAEMATTGPVDAPGAAESAADQLTIDARVAMPSASTGTSADTNDAAARRRPFAALLGEFRRTAVLLPLADDGSPLVADFGGVRWIYAFSDEAALARFAIARGEGARAWAYDRVLGARLLDAAVAATGVPCGVALDVGSADNGVVLPPVAGVVPDTAAVDAVPYTEKAVAYVTTDGNR
ncbi:hypothetical protein ACFTZF_45795 [Streptomyces mirabilis]|uniref:hypothetical protein n=1 Tax=Streptomyces mirabilis TaxID=68239 RepID=UPI00363AF1A7